MLSFTVNQTILTERLKVNTFIHFPYNFIHSILGEVYTTAVRIRQAPHKDYKEECITIEEAYQRERQLHGWSRAKKEALIK